MLYNLGEQLIAPAAFSQVSDAARRLFIVQKLDEVHKLFDEETTVNDGFLSGTLGLICYYYHAAGVLQQQSLKDKAEELLQNVFEGINHQNERLAGCTFGNGLAGFTAVVDYLQQFMLIDIDVESEFAELDQLFFTTALQWIEVFHTDYLHGAFGIIHYFSLRKPTPVICNYLQVLITSVCNKAVVEVENGGVWIRNDSLRNSNAGLANLGLAHGMCGMLMILMNASKSLSAASIRQVKQVVQKATTFLLHCRRQPNAITNRYSQFPFFVHPGKNSDENTPNRLAWCYGDLNEVLLLHRAAHFLNDATLQTIATNIGSQTMLRTDEIATKVVNAHFCHGASGVAQMYLVLYNETGLQQYSKAYHLWIDKTFAYLETDIAQNTFAGKKTDLLDGLPGAALVLLSYLSEEEHTWGRLLLL